MSEIQLKYRIMNERLLDRKETEVVAVKKTTRDTKIISSSHTTKESETKWRVAGCVKVGG